MTWTERKWLKGTDLAEVLSSGFQQLAEQVRLPENRLRQVLATLTWLGVSGFKDASSRRVIKAMDEFVASKIDREQLEERLIRESRCPAFDIFGFPFGGAHYGLSRAKEVEQSLEWYVKATHLVPHAAVVLTGRARTKAVRKKETFLLNVLRDVLGNPFRPTQVDPRWRTSDVLGICLKIQAEYSFGLMPILAEALQDAGCSDKAVVAHCMNDGLHIRGCWVIDSILGAKSWPPVSILL